MDLKLYLQTHRLTLREFADLLGTSHTQVNRWASGKRLPSIIMAAKIARVTAGRVKPQDFIPKDAA